MKALEILKHKWVDANVVFENGEHIRFLKYTEKDINVIIEELEALQNKSCDGCKYEGTKVIDCLDCYRFYPDRYEAKDKE